MISRTSDRMAWFTDAEKEQFLALLERFARGFYVQIHAFCVMSNHFHLLVTELAEEAAQADRDEMVRRYRRMYGRRATPPAGPTVNRGRGPEVESDPEDPEGTERLRARLGSISRFVQELKQAFSRWYNARYERKGYLWGDRFKGVLVSKAGDAEVVCAGYIDLNPIRAEMVKRPEDYRWSSMGLRARDPKRARRLLTALAHPEVRRHGYDWYRLITYMAGALPAAGKRGRLSDDVVRRVEQRAGRLGILEQLRYRCANISEGLALGEPGFITKIQESVGRKFKRARQLFSELAASEEEATGPPGGLYGTRVLRKERSPETPPAPPD